MVYVRLRHVKLKLPTRSPSTITPARTAVGTQGRHPRQTPQADMANSAARLATVKKKYDRSNLFRVSQNIKPA
jgi:hypothetical protein